MFFVFSSKRFLTFCSLVKEKWAVLVHLCHWAEMDRFSSYLLQPQTGRKNNWEEQKNKTPTGESCKQQGWLSTDRHAALILKHSLLGLLREELLKTGNKLGKQSGVGLDIQFLRTTERGQNSRFQRCCAGRYTENCRATLLLILILVKIYCITLSKLFYTLLSYI